MARFSIIIPLFGSTEQFEETLASVLLYRPEHSQIIVVHCDDYQDPYDLEKEVDFICMSDSGQKKPNLTEMFNEGIRNARGKWIGFLRPGVRLPENWEVSIESAFGNPEVAAVSPVLVHADQPDAIASVGVTKGFGYTRQQVASGRRIGDFHRSRANLIGPTNWAAFYRRSILNALGDCDPQLDAIYFDLDLGLSIAAIGLSVVLAEDCQITLEDVASFESESLQPHGCSAQRGFKRFEENEDQASAVAANSFRWSLMMGLVSLPWRPSALIHALGRRKAAKFSEIDRVHRELLTILEKQRDRLISPGLHLHVLAKQKAQNRSVKRAA